MSLTGSHEGRWGKTLVQVVLGVWLMVAVYAIAHDQYVVRIAPEHFTLHHPNPLGIRRAWLLALVVAAGASVPPAVLLALAAFGVARVGPRPKVEPRTILLGVAAVIGLTELTAEIAGVAWWLGFGTVFPEAAYPGVTPSLRLAQTIQLTCYSAAAVFSLGFLGFLHRRRARAEADRPAG